MVPTPRTWFHSLARHPAVLTSGAVLVTVLPIVLIALFSVRTAETSLRVEISAGNLAWARSVAAHLDTMIEDHVGVLRSFAGRPAFESALEKRDRKEILRQLRELAAIVPHAEGSFLALPDGRLFANYPETPEVWGTDISSRPGFRGVTERKGPHVSEIHRRLAGGSPHGFTVAIPVFGADERLMGVFGLHHTLDIFRHYLSGHKRERGYFYVVDQRGRVAVHPRRDPAGPPADFSSIHPVREVLAGGEGVVEFENPFEGGGHMEIAAYAPIRKAGWGVVVDVLEDEAFAPVRRLKWTVAALAGTLAAAAGAGAASAGRLYAERERLLAVTKRHGEEMEEAVARRTNRLQVLSDLSREVLECVAPECAGRLACHAAVDGLGFRMAWVGLADEAAAVVNPIAQVGFEEEHLRSIDVRYDESEKGQGPTGRAIRTGKAVVFDRLWEEPLFRPWAEAARARGCGSSAAFPLLVEQKAIGALSVYSVEEVFPRDETGPLQTIANDAAQAVHRLQLWEKIVRGKRQWEETFDAMPLPVFLHDREFRILRVNAAYARHVGTLPSQILGRRYFNVFPRRDGPLPTCLEAIGRRIPAVEEFEEDGRSYLSTAYSVCDAAGEYVFSVHVMDDVTDRRLAEEKIRVEVDLSTALVEAAGVISRFLDRDTLIREIPPLVEKIVRCERCALYVWDQPLEAFVPAAVHGFPEHLVPLVRGTSFRAGDLPLIGEAISKKAVVAVDDAPASPLLTREVVERFELGAVLVSPIVSQDRILGGIVIAYTKPHSFTQRETALAKGVADHLSVAFVNAALYREAQEKAMLLAHRLETIQVMHEIDRGILSTLSREEILDSVVHLVGRLVPCDRATVVTVEPDAGGFKYVAGWGIEGIPKGTIVPFADTNATEVVKGRRMVSRPDLSLEGPLLPLDREFYEQGFRSDLRIPIIIRGEVGAILNLGSRRVGAFTADHLATIEKVVGQIGVALENARLVEDLEDLFLGTVKTLASAIDAKSPWTKGHSERVTDYAVSVGQAMGLTEKEIRDLRLAGLLHDIGKIGTYESLLDKPEKLTPEEFEIVKAHPAKGAEMLAPIKQFGNVIPGVRSHHERWDGTGYPDGLAGEAIPLFGRILAAADTYDSITADRPYRKSPGKAWAIEEIRRCAGTQFDPRVVDVFLSLGPFPEREGLA